MITDPKDSDKDAPGDSDSPFGLTLASSVIKATFIALEKGYTSETNTANAVATTSNDIAGDADSKMESTRTKFLGDYKKAFPDWLNINQYPSAVESLDVHLKTATTLDAIRKVLNNYIAACLCSKYIPFVPPEDLQNHVAYLDQALLPLKTSLKGSGSASDREKLLDLCGAELLARFKTTYRNEYNVFRLASLQPTIAAYVSKLKFTDSGLGVGILRDTSSADCKEIVQVLSPEFTETAKAMLAVVKEELAALKISNVLLNAEQLTRIPSGKFGHFYNVTGGTLQALQANRPSELAASILKVFFKELDILRDNALVVGLKKEEASELLSKFKKVTLSAFYFNALSANIGAITDKYRHEADQKNFRFVLQTFFTSLVGVAAYGYRDVDQSGVYAIKTGCEKWPKEFKIKLNDLLGRMADHLERTIRAIEA